MIKAMLNVILYPFKTWMRYENEIMQLESKNMALDAENDELKTKLAKISAVMNDEL